MPRFVILHHEMPPDSERPTHWDLMLESGQVLRTWALQAEPQGQIVIAAERLPDHRLAYLEYEGPVSNNRGFVIRWDHGEYLVIASEEALIEIKLLGLRMSCLLRLAADVDNDLRWTAAFRPLH